MHEFIIISRAIKSSNSDRPSMNSFTNCYSIYDLVSRHVNHGRIVRGRRSVNNKYRTCPFFRESYANVTKFDNSDSVASIGISASHTAHYLRGNPCHFEKLLKTALALWQICIGILRCETSIGQLLFFRRSFYYKNFSASRWCDTKIQLYGSFRRKFCEKWKPSRQTFSRLFSHRFCLSWRWCILPIIFPPRTRRNNTTSANNILYKRINAIHRFSTKINMTRGAYLGINVAEIH